MKVVYSLRALTNLDDIADYLVPRNPRAALRVRDAIIRTTDLIALFPGADRVQRGDVVRKTGVRGYPYMIYYTVDEAAGRIVVVSVRHDKRPRVYFDT